MGAWSETLSGWMVDYYLLSTVVLAAAVVVTSRVRQPVRRLTVARSAFAGLATLAALGALPGWPRAYWRDRPLQSHPNATAVAVSSDQDSEIAIPDHIGFWPKHPASSPPPWYGDGIRAGLATTQSAFGPSVGMAPNGRAFDWLGLVARVFTSGAALMLTWLGVGFWQTAFIRRRSRLAPRWTRDLLAHMVGAGEIAPELLVSTRLAQPVAVGLLRPAIILPEWFVGEEPRWRLEAALAHEWTHFRNRDLWWITISGLLLPVLFAHPLYWWLRRQAREDQELLADAAAAEGREDYAEALLAWARLMRERPRLAGSGSLALWERPSQLKKRILMLLDRDFRLEQICSRGWSLGVRCVMALFVLALSVLTLRPADVAAGDSPGEPQAFRKSGLSGHGALDSGETGKANPRGGKLDEAGAGDHGFLPLGRMLGHTAGIGELVISPDGQKALSCSFDGTIRLWDIASGKPLRTLGEYRSPLRSVVFSRDGRRALISGNEPTIRYWDIETGKELQRFEGHSGIVHSAVLACDDRRMLSCGQDGTLRWWDTATGRQLSLLDVRESPIRSIAVSPDGRRAFSGGDDGIGRVWDLGRGEMLHRVEGQTGPIWHVAIAPNGRMGLTAGQDRRIHLWDLQTGRHIRRYQGHEGEVNNLVFSPDGSRFLSASDDETIRLWDVETAKVLGLSTGLASHVGAVAISPDGKLAMTGGDDSRILLWELPE